MLMHKIGRNERLSRVKYGDNEVSQGMSLFLPLGSGRVIGGWGVGMVGAHQKRVYGSGEVLHK